MSRIEFTRFLDSERDRWTRVTRERHITLD